MIFVRPYLMTLSKPAKPFVAVQFQIEGEYEEMETIAEKIDWLEKYLFELDNIRDQVRDMNWV